MNTATEFETLRHPRRNAARPGRHRHVRRRRLFHRRRRPPGTRPAHRRPHHAALESAPAPELQGDGPKQHRCCSLDDVYDAKRVAQHLNFPHYVVNFEQQFEQRVVRPFVDQYLAGRTPIACTNCNTDVKFEPLLRMARQIGAERLATGHYARIRRNEQSGRWELLARAR